MWVRPWNQAVSFEKNFHRSLKCLEETVHRSLLGFDQAAGEDLQGGEELLLRTGGREILATEGQNFSNTVACTLWKVENVPHPPKVLKVPARSWLLTVNAKRQREAEGNSVSHAGTETCCGFEDSQVLRAVTVFSFAAAVTEYHSGGSWQPGSLGLSPHRCSNFCFCHHMAFFSLCVSGFFSSYEETSHTGLRLSLLQYGLILT